MNAVRQWVVDFLLYLLAGLGYDFKGRPEEILKSAREMEIMRGNAWKAAAKAFRGKVVDEADAVAQILENAKRSGTPTDDPEGSRFIVVSDTLARALASRLRAAIGGENK